MIVLEPRKPIKGGQWIVTLQLEVDGHHVGDPLTLRYVDSVLAGGKTKGKVIGMPDDFGPNLSRALYERASQLRPVAGRAKR